MVLNGVCGRLTMKTEHREKGNRKLAQRRAEAGAVCNHRSVGDKHKQEHVFARLTSLDKSNDITLMSAWKEAVELTT